MQFKDFATHLQDIESVSSRLAITEKLSHLFSQLSMAELSFTPYLLQGKVAPAYTGIEFGMAEKSVIKAAAHALQLDSADFAKEVRKVGDLGSAIENARSLYASFEQEDLTLEQVFNELKRITQSSGGGSQEVKSNILAHLFVRLDALSCKFIARIPLGQLRLGASDITILDAYSWMLAGDKTLRGKIEKAYQVRPDLGYIGSRLKTHGISTVEQIEPEVFTPILMMKAERLSSGVEIIEKIGECILEPKYDGLRLQIHVKKNLKSEVQGSERKPHQVEIFTRGLEKVTYMYPDIVEGVLNELSCDECIIEGEALGYNPDTDSFLPFQETIQRKRKHAIAEAAIKIPLRLMLFDVLLVNGKNLLQEPLIERKKILAHLLTSKTKKATIHLSPMQMVAEAADIERLFDVYVSEGLEGIMAKKQDSVYKPGAREFSWVKLKRSYSSKVNDTIDCVVMGYDAGKGKRASFGIGAVLVGVRNDKDDTYATLAKIGTGMTDEEWKELKIQSTKHKVQDRPQNYAVKKEMECDFWVLPHIVLEIRCDELTKSKLHTSGWGMRFPRLERFREKLPEDATTLREIEVLAGNNTHS